MSTPLEQVVYIAEASADFGREGGVRILDAEPSAFSLVKPPGMGGRGGDAGVNPEQLFAAGYAACFHGALLFNARHQGVALDGSTVTARVSIGRVADGGFGLAVELEIHLPGVPQDKAEALVEIAHVACPYSRATRGNIDVELRTRTDG
jgi:lipoyl-dependent peroxiredoxin